MLGLRASFVGLRDPFINPSGPRLVVRCRPEIILRRPELALCWPERALSRPMSPHWSERVIRQDLGAHFFRLRRYWVDPKVIFRRLWRALYRPKRTLCGTQWTFLAERQRDVEAHLPALCVVLQLDERI